MFQSQDHNFDPFLLFLVERYNDVEFVDPISSDRKCVGCQEVAIFPFKSSCGHVFCNGCASNYGPNLRRTKCPKCRINLPYPIKNRNLELEEQIKNLKIKCLNHEFGCTYESVIGEIQEHVNMCRRNIDQQEENSFGLRDIETTDGSDVSKEISFTDDELKISNIESACGSEDVLTGGGPSNEVEKERDLKTNEKKIDINILLLGPTGVGKSTFINALANYLLYEDMDAAMNSELKVLIPCQFSISDKQIRVGNGGVDEVFKVGQSSTQWCKTYEFQHRGHVIRVFDTPGVGDTRGVEQDKRNLEEYLGVLARFRHLHRICILLRPNLTRIDVAFEYCIKQLLSQLHRNAKNKITFVFTNARSTFYTLGETKNILEKLLKRIELKTNLKVPFNRTNTVLVDSEAFRFLACVKQDPHFSREYLESYRNSWNVSRNSCKTLIDCVLRDSGNEGHETDEMLCIFKVRQAISDLSEPLMYTLQFIWHYKNILKHHVETLEQSGNDKKNVNKWLYIPDLKLIVKKCQAFRVVCQSNRCTDNNFVSKVKAFHYPQICFRCKDAQQNLRNCKVLSEETGNCLACKCPNSQHRIIEYESFVEEKKIVDIFEGSENSLEKAEIVSKILKAKLEEIEPEESALTKNLAKLAHFVQKNAIVSRNDAFKEYLEMQIKNANLSDEPDLEKELEQLKESYLENKDMIDRLVRGHEEEEAMSTEQVKNILGEIESMKSSGKVFRSAIEDRKWSKPETITQWQVWTSVVKVVAILLLSLIN